MRGAKTSQAFLRLCLTEARFTGLYTGSSLYGRRQGLSEQQKLQTLCKELVKGTQDLMAGPQCLGRSLWGCIFQQPWAEQYPQTKEKSSGQKQVGSHLWALWEHEAHPA